MWPLLLSLCLAAAPALAGPPPEPSPHPRWWPPEADLEGDISPIHDPAIIRQGGTYHVFASNRFAEKLVPMFCSPDRRRWTLCGNVFDAVPEWALQEVPGARGIWAPDISFFEGRYHLYYSVSTFGKNRSVIGLTTNRTLDPRSPDYRWVDEGKVVGSTPEDDWNAIDPNLARDERGSPWLVWGSFWGGIKMRRIDARTGKLSAANPTLLLAGQPAPLDAALDRGALHRQEGQVLLPLRVLRHVLPGQGQHLQDHGGAGEEDHGPLYR